MMRQGRSCVADGGTLFMCPCDVVLTALRCGNLSGTTSVTSGLPGMGTVAIIATRPGQRRELRAAALSRFAVNLPDLPGRVAGRDIAFIGTGPEQWLAQGRPG